MILALDVGNSHIFGGVVSGEEILVPFRKTTKAGITSDELGVFLRGVLRENDVPMEEILHIAICSVVPDLLHTLNNTCLKYFNQSPFILHTGVKTGLKIQYRNPQEVGMDRIANAIAGLHLFPGKNFIIVDFGTATTFCVVNKKKEYLGGIILPGLRISMQALSLQTAKLPIVEIKPPSELVGKTTVEAIQSGLYYGHLATIREVSRSIEKEYLNSEKPVLIGTGGFVRLFEKEKLFDAIIPDLVLMGLAEAVKMNR